MKAKKTIEEMHVDIGIPASLTAETGMAVMTAENLIRCYENEAAKILKDHGCPLTFAELCKKRNKFLPDLANGRGTSPVYGVFWMLLGFNNVRVYLRNNNAEGAVCEMAYALNWASDMQIRPVELLIEIGASRSKKQKDNRGKRETWNGLTREQISARDQKIIEHYKQRRGPKHRKTHLSISGFADVYAEEYNLKPRRVRDILKLKFGTLPG